MDSKIADDWLQELANTANAKNFAAHMDLVSRQVAVFGVPGFEVIGYSDWAAQCKHEFENNILKRVTYQGLRVIQERILAPDEMEFDRRTHRGQ